jgi:hypothetical protein
MVKDVKQTVRSGDTRVRVAGDKKHGSRNREDEETSHQPRLGYLGVVRQDRRDDLLLCGRAGLARKAGAR